MTLYLVRSVCFLPLIAAGAFMAHAPSSLPPLARGAAGFSAIALVLHPSTAEARRFGGGRSFGGIGRARSFGARSFSRRSYGRGYGARFSGRRGLGGFGLGMGLGMLGGWGFGGFGLFGLGRMLLFPLVLLFILKMMSRR